MPYFKIKIQLHFQHRITKNYASKNCCILNYIHAPFPSIGQNWFWFGSPMNLLKKQAMFESQTMPSFNVVVIDFFFGIFPNFIVYTIWQINIAIADDLTQPHRKLHASIVYIHYDLVSSHISNVAASQLPVRCFFLRPQIVTLISLFVSNVIILYSCIISCKQLCCHGNQMSSSLSVLLFQSVIQFCFQCTVVDIPWQLAVSLAC